MRVAVEVLVPLRLFVCRFLSQHRINLLLALGAVAHLNLNFSKKFRLEERSWKADSLKEEKINITHMKSMRRTENIMFHFVMVKKSTRIWK